MTEKTFNARQLALRICIAIVDKGQSLSSQLEKQLKSLGNSRDQGLCSELCYGFCRYYYVLAAELKSLLQKPLKPKDLDLQIILLIGLYQIRFMRIDDHAAVNETVNLVLQRKKKWAKGLVNAVLRNYLRRYEKGDPQDRFTLSELEHVVSYPSWMRNQIESDWGDDSATVLRAGNQSPPMVLRLDQNQKSRAEYLLILQDRGIQATAHALVSSALVLDQAIAVDQIPGFDSALVSVQDAAAQLAAGLLSSQPGMHILDACAAPGGKTLHILQSEPDLSLIALDKDQQRLQRVEQNLQRARLDAKLICADAVQTQTWFDGIQFDRILLDAPCSASGIIRRHPDIRILRQAEDIPKLVKQQRDLLDAVWPLLKTGGRMLYSTCSIFQSENECQIADFISRQPDCIELGINAVQWGHSRQYGRQILPGFDNMDGFYYALLEKRG